MCQPSIMRKWFSSWSLSRRTGQITATLLLATTTAVLILAHVYHLGVPGIIVALLPGLPGLWLAWVPYRDQQKTAQETNLRELSDQLAMAVARQWETEAKIRRLNDPYPLPVSWSAADPDLTDNWAVIEALGSTGAGRPMTADRDTWANGPAELAGQGDGLAAVLAQVPTRRLVVLGEPGAGKTILMVRLVLDLLASRQAGMPVPFLVPLASWNPLSQGLDEWLATRLTVNHSALTAAAGDGTQAQALLEAGLILPLLDGLDEIPEVIRGPAIAQINEELRPGITVAVFRRVAALPLSVTPVFGGRLRGVTSFRPSLVTLSWWRAAGRCSGASGRRPGAACVVVTSAARRRAGRG
jgi:NACHT domain